jgi:hypothetical protein
LGFLRSALYILKIIRETKIIGSSFGRAEGTMEVIVAITVSLLNLV